MAKVVPPGYMFLRQMIDTTTLVSQPDNIINLTEHFKKDLMWWHCFITQWKGKSFFMFPNWIPSTALNLFTDSSGTLGYGAYFDKKWFHGCWSKEQEKIASNGKLQRQAAPEADQEPTPKTPLPCIDI